MFKNGTSNFSFFENRYNKVFNCQVNETLNDKKNVNFFSYTKNFNKTKNETYECVRVVGNNKNIIEYSSKDKESWKSQESNNGKNYYLFFLDKVILNRNMIGYHKYLFNIV